MCKVIVFVSVIYDSEILHSPAFPLNTKKEEIISRFQTFIMLNYLDLGGILCIDVKTPGQSPQVSCVFFYEMCTAVYA